MPALQAEPFRFDFFRAVRLLQSHYRSQPRIGYSESLAQDPLRFAQSPSLIFAPSTLEAVRQRAPDQPVRIFAYHFGLFGPNGPLPLSLTEYALERLRHHGDRTFAEFANVLQHRLASFFFRAWADSRKEVDLDRPEEQRWAVYVGSLIGLGLESHQRREDISDWSLLYHAGRLAQQTRNAEGLRAILQDYFDVPAEVETFRGRWLNLPPDSVCRLGASPDSGSLGLTTIVGGRVWNCQLGFRLRLGPMKLEDFERLLPGSRSFRRLRTWVRHYTHDHFFWDVQLVLLRSQVPQVRLGTYGRLGWTTWLKTRPFEHDAEDLVVVPPSAGD